MKRSSTKSVFSLLGRNTGITLLATLFVFLISGAANAQISGTKTVPGDYVTIAAAVADLNTNGIGAGGVTINVAAGHTEVAPAGGISLTATGTLANPIVIQKSGAGTNPTITAFAGQTSGNLNDAVIKLIGADYVTIDGLTLQEDAANTTTAAATNNMTEWGIALLYATATDGAQNNTIKNSTITLNRTYQNTFGIYSNSTHTAAAVTTSATATGTTGGNSGLKILSNNISNVNMGIVVVGPTAAADHNDGLTIGGLGNGNTITDFGTTGTFSAYANVSGSVNGILVRNVRNFNVSYNTITSSNGGTTAGTLRGIYFPSYSNAIAGTTTNVINNNSISLKSAVAAGTINSISVEATTVNATSTLDVNNNDINNTGHTVAASGAITFILQAGVPLNLNVNNNTFTNLTVNTTGSVILISNNVSAPTAGSTYNTNGNSIVTAFNKTGAGGTLTFFTTNASSVAGTFVNNLNNNFSNITVTGATTIAGWSNTDGGTPTKAVSNNTFSNIVGGTSAITIININFGINTASGNVISNVTGGGAVTGISRGTSGTIGDVIGNTISGLSSTGASAVTGIAYGGNGAGVISKNKIYDLQVNNAGGTVFGVSITSLVTPLNVSNNYIGNLTAPISSASADAVRGFNITSTSSSSNINMYYNTVYLNASSSGTNFSSSALFHTTSGTATTATLTSRNNIFINTSTPSGTGITSAYRRSSTTLTNFAAASNNNIYYAGTPSASRLIFYDGTNSDQTMAAYKTRVSPRESNSVTENVPFLSTVGANVNFLHIDPTVATQAESGGANITGFTDDYDGNVRQGNPGYAGTGTSPDIGADEGNFILLDLTSPSITHTQVGFTCSTGDRVISASITDATGVPLSGGTVPRVYYRKNSGAWFSQAGVNTGGTTTNSTWNFTIVASDLGGVALNDTIRYYLIAQDAAPSINVSSLPTGVVATNVNSVTTPPTSVFSYLINNVLLAGTYTVGVGGNYTTLTAAVSAYNNSCLVGPVIFSLTDATYPSETFPISINANGFASSVNTLTIRPNTGMTPLLVGANATSLITMNGAKYVTIDGSNNGSTSKDLTIRNKSVAPTILLINDANNDVVKNSVVEGINTNSSSGTIFFSTSTGTTGNSNNMISGCDIKPRADSTITPANGIYSSGSASALNANNTIVGCNIFNFTSMAVNITGTGVGDNWNISQNHIYQTTARTTVTTGISILGARDGHIINDNFIGGSTINAGGAHWATSTTFTGITAVTGTITPASIQGNTVKNIRSTTIAFTASYGVYLQGGKALINNNTVGSANLAESIQSNGDNMGIRSTSASIVTVSNNTVVNMVTTPTVPTGEWTFGIQVDGAGAHTVSNNTVTGLANGSVPDGSFNTQVICLNVIATGIQTVTGNTISNCGNTSAVVNPSASFNNRVWGIIVSGTAVGTVVEKNKIETLYGTSTTNGARADVITGIQSQTSANATISNNMVNLSGGGASSDRFIFGLLDLSGTTGNYYYNTVNISGTATTANPTYAFNRNATTAVNVKNNIFTNQRTGGTGFHVAMANTAAATGWSASSSDYNFVSNVDSTHVTQWLGALAANNKTLSGFKTSSAGDSHSKNKAPIYVSASDLHLQQVVANNPFVDAGVAISGITTDIDNQVRSTVPDIGADEFQNRPATPASLTQSVIAPSCTGGSTLFVSPTAPVGITYYLQSNATDTSTANPFVGDSIHISTNGIYYVNARSSITQLWSAGSATVTVTNVPVAVLPPSPTPAATPACLSTTITVPAPGSPNVTYYWQGTNPLGVSTAQNASTPLTVTTSGTYYVAAFDASSNCWSNTNGVAVVIDPTVPAAPTVGANISRCVGAVSANITGNAGSNTLTWWDASSNGNQIGSGTPFQTVGTPVLPNTNTPGVYTFYAQSNSVACVSTTRVPVTVTVNALPTVDAGPTQTNICPGAIITLSGSGASTYTWTGGITNAVPFHAPNVTTLYTVTGTNSNGCQNTDTVSIFVLPATAVDITPAGPIITCQNQPVLLTAVGPLPGPATTITQWNFNNSDLIPNTGTGTALLIGGTTGTFASGAVSTDPTQPGFAWNTTGYPAVSSNPRTAGTQFNVSTAGFTNVGFRYDVRHSGTAANTYVVQYNPDVTNGLAPWISVDTLTYSVNNTFQPATIDLTNFPGVNNNPNLGMRIVSDFAASGSSYVGVTAAYGTGGTVRYDMVTFTGQPLTATYSWTGGATTQSITPPTSGNYVVTVTEPGVCPGKDSVLVTINPTYAINTNPTICGNQTYNVFGVGPVNTSGIYTENRTSVKGCDSTVFVNLTVYPVYATPVTATICSNQTYTLANGNVVSAAGTYVRTVPTIHNCDSVVTVTLIVKPAQSIPVAASICAGQSYTLPSGTVVNTAGVYNSVFTAANGCDSTIVTTLTVKPVFTSTQNHVICSGDTHTMPNGTQQGTAGTYTFPYSAINGCDSTITVTLVVNPVFTTNATTDLCPGETYTLVDGTVISTAGVHTATTNTINGCDSTVILTATMRSAYNTPVTASICQGGTYTLVNGANVSTAGTYTSGTQSIYGCDSVVTVTLSVNPVYNQTASASICQGETYQLPNGTTVSAAGVYTSNLTSSKGCDSTIVTTLTVNPLPNVNLGNNIAVLNPPVTLSAGVGFASYLWTPGGATTSTLQVTQNGTYSVTVTNQFGCEATDEVQVNFLASVVNLGENGGSISLFPNPTSDRFTINVYGYTGGGNMKLDIINAIGQVVKTEVVANATETFTKEMDIATLASGTYTLRVQGQNASANLRLVIAR